MNAAAFQVRDSALACRKWSIASIWLFCLLAASTFATTVRPPKFSELVAEAQFIGRAKVVAVNSVWSDTAQGRVIKTHVTLEVLKTIKGRSEPTITLQMLGGVIGDEVMRVSGMPQFEVGQTEFVFVTGNGIRFCPLVGMMHGRYRIRTDPATNREYIARNDGVPLEDVSEVELRQDGNSVASRLKSAASALSPDLFESKIAEEVARREQIQ